jgi:hypothetical protein
VVKPGIFRCVAEAAHRLKLAKYLEELRTIHGPSSAYPHGLTMEEIESRIAGDEAKMDAALSGDDKRAPALSATPPIVPAVSPKSAPKQRGRK